MTADRGLQGVPRRVPREWAKMQGNLSDATQALREGRLGEAEQRCRAVLAQDPTSADAWNLLGAIAGRAQQHELAADMMRKSVQLAPHVVAFRSNLAKALLHQRAWDEAEATLRPALQLEPANHQLLALWSTVRARQGNLPEAIDGMQRAMAASPDTAAYHFNLAELYRRQREYDKAIEQFQRTLALQPDHADTLNNLAGLYLIQGNFLEALRATQRVLKLRPRSVQAYSNLATLMKAVGDLPAAVQALRNAITLDDSARVRFQLATTLLDAGELEEAESLIRGLRAASDEDPLAFKAVHARILENKGELEAAQAILQTIDAAHYRDPDVALILAVVQQQQGRIEEAIGTLEAIDRTKVRPVDEIGIQFSLGKLYDSLGRFDAAFEAFRAGNENRKNLLVKLDAPDRAEKPIERLIRCYQPQRYRDCPTSTLDTEVPIFIIGMPRSGTSLTEQILSSHSQVYGAGELTTLRDLVRKSYDGRRGSAPLEIVDTDRGDEMQWLVPCNWEHISAEQLTEIAAAYLDAIRQLGGDAPRITDKMPTNYLVAPLIHKLFPRGRIIHCLRDPLDTCLSCYFQNFTVGSHAAFDLKELAGTYRAYVDAMQHWRDALAVPMLEVQYETLVQDPEPTVRQMLSYCGLDWEPNCLSFHKSRRVVKTASYQQVRKPIYTSSVGRWKNYRKHLAPLIDALGIDHEQQEQAAATR